MKNNFDLKGYMKQNQVGAYQQLNEMWYQDINQPLGDFNEAKVIDSLNEEEEELQEKGDVKSIGDAGKMAHANTRTNLGRHRSSDILDKQAAKDHDKKTVVGAKAAAYKAPHMNEEEKFYSVGDPDLTLNDLNKDIVITPFELEKAWKDVYGEDFKTEYSGAYSYLTKNYKNFTIVDLGDVWERMYGEDFLYEYPGIAKWLFSNEGKQSSKDKVAPKMYENEEDVFAGSDDANWDGRKGGDYWNRDTEWEKNVIGKEINGWVAGEESQAGSIFWENPKYPNSLIYATPGWEGVNGIAVEVHDSEDGYLDEPILQKVVGVGTDKWKTEEGYLALMAKILPVIEKMLKPVEMEDHGTAVDHDMNDNISKDHSELEGTVYEEENPFGAIKTGIDKITMGDDDMGDDDRLMSMGGDQIKAGIESLIADGFDYREILELVKNVIRANRNK